MCALNKSVMENVKQVIRENATAMDCSQYQSSYIVRDENISNFVKQDLVRWNSLCINALESSESVYAASIRNKLRTINSEFSAAVKTRCGGILIMDAIQFQKSARTGIPYLKLADTLVCDFADSPVCRKWLSF